MKNVVVVSTTASSYLADRIARRLRAPRFSLERKRFGDGQAYYRLGVLDRLALVGKDVVFVASTHTDADLLEVSRVGGDLATEYGTERRIFAIPFFGSSAMDRAVKPGEIVVAKHDARLLSNMPRAAHNVFFLMDTHTEGLVHYFEGDCFRRELYAESVLVEGIRAFGLRDFVIASADLGRPKWVKTFAARFGARMAFVDKDRAGEESRVFAVVGDVRGKHVVIYDDMTRSAKTLLHAIGAYLQNGARSVYAVLSHGGFNSPDVIAELIHSPVKKIVITNSHPMSQHPLVKNSRKFVVKDVSPIFTDAIKKILST